MRGGRGDSERGRGWGPLALAGLVVGATAGAGCGYVSTRPAGEAFDRSVGGGQQVRYSARCLSCRVTFRSADGLESEDIEGSRDRSFWLEETLGPMLGVCRSERDTHLVGEISVGGQRRASDELSWATPNTASCITLTA